ncbi:MAG: lytic transglycosylase domain-containing protein [Cytophagales bacterium]|nr:lytic transglycosylase domain-containing protein [Armatimonadota bacterium]
MPLTTKSNTVQARNWCRFPGAAVVLAACVTSLIAAQPLVASAQAGAAKYSFQTPTEQYLAMRRAYPPTPALTPALLAAEPRKWRGQTLELEGRLSGIVRTDEGGATVMLDTGRYGYLTLSMSQVPVWLQSGERLRVLAVATGGDTANGQGDSGDTTVMIGVAEMQVVCVASASDIIAAESRSQKTAEDRSRRNQAALNAASAQLARSMSRRGRGALASRSRASGVPGRPMNGLSPTALAVFQPYRDFIWRHNRRLTAAEADAITSSLLLFSERYDVDPRLVVALIIAESDFNPRSTSNKGAMGLGQIMPDEAKTLGLSNPYDPVQNVAGAIYLLRGRLNKYSGGAGQKDLQSKHIVLALASYNAGMGAVKKYGGVPPYRETQNYVRKITKLYQQLCAGDGQKRG